MTQKMGWGKVLKEMLLCALVSMLLVWTLSGFAHGSKHDATATMIPLNCLHEIHITDFLKPCKLDSKNPNVAHCDDVVIHFACVDYRTGEHANPSTP